MGVEVQKVWGAIQRQPAIHFPRYFYIRTKEAETNLLKLNFTQRAIHRVFKEQRQQKRPVRIIVLKPRRTGVSTYCEGLLYSQTATQENIESLVVAHDKGTSQEILRMSNRYYEEFPAELRPMLSRAGKNELFFGLPPNPMGRGDKDKELKSTGLVLNSRIRVETAGNLKLGRGFLAHNLHISEFALWTDQKKTMLSLLSSVPYLPNTMIIIESTAFGIGDRFHAMYCRARENKGDFRAVFVPWYRHEDYTLKRRGRRRRTSEEQKLVEEWKLEEIGTPYEANCRLAWREWCIEERCDGDLDLFHQEYPATDDEAFIASGKSVFPFISLRDHFRPIARAACGKDTHHVVTDEAGEERYKVKMHRGQLYGDEAGIHFEENPRGALKVFRGPKEGQRYAIGVDPAEGVAGGDATCFQVLDRTTREQGAVWYANTDLDLAAEELERLARWYNLAWLMVESNACGEGLMSRLRESYPRLYKHEKLTTTGFETKWGIRMTKPIKEDLVSRGQAAIRKLELLIYDQETIEDLIHFIRDGKKLRGEGRGDDRTMAWLIALYACEQIPYYLEEDEPVLVPVEGQELNDLFLELTKPRSEQDPFAMSKWLRGRG
jgi:hypothetical protein